MAWKLITNTKRPVKSGVRVGVQVDENKGIARVYIAVSQETAARMGWKIGSVVTAELGTDDAAGKLRLATSSQSGRKLIDAYRFRSSKKDAAGSSLIIETPVPEEIVRAKRATTEVDSIEEGGALIVTVPSEFLVGDVRPVVSASDVERKGRAIPAKAQPAAVPKTAEVEPVHVQVDKPVEPVDVESVVAPAEEPAEQPEGPHTASVATVEPESAPMVAAPVVEAIQDVPEVEDDEPVDPLAAVKFLNENGARITLEECGYWDHHQGRVLKSGEIQGRALRKRQFIEGRAARAAAKASQQAA